MAGFIDSNLFWMLMGMLFILICFAFKAFVEDRGWPMTWWKWVLSIAWYCLFGLAFFITEQRTKEIGIRKVLGASVSGIVGMLSKEFIGWAVLANVLAWPVAYMVMKRWLQNFAYRINIGIGVFIMAGVIALMIVLLSVSCQSVKAASSHPADTLRYE